MPVSSSGHLVIGQHLLGINEPGVSLEIILHLGTLLAVFAFYYDRILELFMPLFKAPKRYHRTGQFRTVLALIIGTVPAVIVGLFFNDAIDAAFSNPRYACLFLIVTGGILLLPKLLSKADGTSSPNLLKGLVIGIAQAFAILPGISRSGSTITMARLLGVDGKKAAEFSFLLSIPAILGATVLKLSESNGIPIEYFIGGGVAAIVGYLSILAVEKLLVRGRFHYFSYWCFLVGIVGLIFIR